MDEEERGLVPAGVVSLPVPVEVIIKEWQDYQRLCQALLTDDDHSTIEGNKRRNKSAWRKLARAFNVTDVILDRVITVDAFGRVVEARYEVQAIAPNGRTSVGIAGCSIWERAHEEDDLWPDGNVKCPGPCDGRKHFSNSDHTIPATAHTRAKNRAIADLIGAGEVSAEEIGAERVVETKARPVDDMPIENPGEQLLGFSKYRDKKIEDVPDDFLTSFVTSGAEWAEGSRQKFPDRLRAVQAYMDEEERRSRGLIDQAEEIIDGRDLPPVEAIFDGEGRIEELQQAFPDTEVKVVAQDTDEDLDAELTIKEFEGFMVHLRKYAEGAGWKEEQVIKLLAQHKLTGEGKATLRQFRAAKDQVQLSVSEGRLEEATE